MRTTGVRHEEGVAHVRDEKLVTVHLDRLHGSRRDLVRVHELDEPAHGVLLVRWDRLEIDQSRLVGQRRPLAVLALVIVPTSLEG
jgi:hypothetical protein